MNSFDELYYNQGYNYICGVDEVGRGPLFGPVVACAVIMKNDFFHPDIKDSKKLSEKKRNILFDIIIENCVSYSISEISAKVIDEINIRQATLLAMKNALNGLIVVPEIVLVDAEHIDTEIEQVSIVKGDDKSFSIACASILAKVYRDRLIVEMAKQYPGYALERNKGYGTKDHREALLTQGPTSEHRSTFIKKILNI